MIAFMAERLGVAFISYDIVFIFLFRIFDGLDTFSVATIAVKLPLSKSLLVLSIK